MELVLEIQNAKEFVPTELWHKTFKQAGGTIGRAENCDWVLPDRKRHLSKSHALVTCHDGAFFITDTSRNGIRTIENGTNLPKGEAVRIEHDSVYFLGSYEIQARLAGVSTTYGVASQAVADSVIPDDAFLELDPLKAFDQQALAYTDIDELITPRMPIGDVHPRADYARIDMENLQVPQLVEAPPEPLPAPAQSAVDRQSQDFWKRFGTALGIDLKDLDHAERENLALDAARLLNQSVDGLQQSLRTHSELKNELRLAQTTVQGIYNNPLKLSVDAGEALGILLRTNKPGQYPAEQVLSRAFRDLQTHQVALLAASRAAIRGALEHFSPSQLTLRFERDQQPLFTTAGSRWKAYGRYHQALRQDDEWSERLLARDFAQAYEEQVRLISTLHVDQRG